MAEKTFKCRNCKEPVKESVAIKDESKRGFYYCSQECRDTYEVKAKEKKQSASSPEQKADFVALTDYLDELYRGECNFPYITSQIKFMKEEHGFKYSGILLTLKYVYETMGEELKTQYGIQYVVTKNYENAKQHYLKCKHNREKSEEMQEDSVKILQSSQHTKQNRNIKLYDLK